MPDPTPREAADFVHRFYTRFDDEAGRALRVLIDHARASTPAEVGPRPSATFPAVDPARDLPKAVDVLRRDAPGRHPYDALLYAMAADVLEATTPGGVLASVDDIDRVCVAAGLVRATSTRPFWSSGTPLRGVTVRVGSHGTDWTVSVRDGVGGVLVADVGGETRSAALLREAITEARRIAGEDR